MSEATNIKRLPLAADTEPSDEELSEVMSEARDLAMARKQTAETWMRRQLAVAVADARARDMPAA